MSLPSTSKPAQLSIRSFFQAQTPKYAPPPNGTSNNTKASSTAAPGPPPPVPATDQPQPQPTIPPIPANLLPPEATVRPVAPADVPALRRINALLLPVSYPDSFYREVATSARLSRVVTWAHGDDAPKIVGAVVCRAEPAVGAAPAALYIRSLCLLAPYRGLGLVSAALDNIVAAAVADRELDVRVVTAHVWEANEEGLAWYNARGFRPIGPPIKRYYLKLRPDGAFFVQRDIVASVRTALPSTESRPASRPIALTPSAAVANLPPPPPPSETTRPPLTTGQSFQNKRAEAEWNDLPADMAPGLMAPPRTPGSGSASATSSRSSSMARKKRDRSYPAAAFGS